MDVMGCWDGWMHFGGWTDGTERAARLKLDSGILYACMRACGCACVALCACVRHCFVPCANQQSGRDGLLGVHVPRTVRAPPLPWRSPLSCAGAAATPHRTASCSLPVYPLAGLLTGLLTGPFTGLLTRTRPVRAGIPGCSASTSSST
jgi:hypothetical protein